MPSAICEHVPMFMLSSTRTGISEDRHATPLIPMPLLPRAATMPATWVPCPTLSDASASLETKSHPRSMRTLGARSGSAALMPESTIATGTDAEPVVWSHAAGAPIDGQRPLLAVELVVRQRRAVLVVVGLRPLDARIALELLAASAQRCVLRRARA